MLEDGDAPRRAVLVDFGSADRAPDENDIPAYAMGTPLTMAPEVLTDSRRPRVPTCTASARRAFRMLTAHYPVEAASMRRYGAHVPRACAGARVGTAGIRASGARSSARSSPILRALAHGESVWSRSRRGRSDAAYPHARGIIGASIAGVAAVSFLAFLVLRPGAGPISRGRLAVPRDANAYHEAWRWVGPEEKSEFGYYSTVVDLDHDRYADLVCTEPHWSGPDKKWRGRILIFRGGPNGPAGEPTTVIEGDVPDATLGYRLVGTRHQLHGFDDRW
jgi:hypothetical protein